MSILSKETRPNQLKSLKMHYLLHILNSEGSCYKELMNWGTTGLGWEVDISRSVMITRECGRFRVIHSRTLASEFFGFDKERIVLLHGYTKRTGQPASVYDLEKAFGYWTEYMRTRRVSPVQEEDNE